MYGSADLQALDAIIHLAALCNDPLGDLHTGWSHEINHTASIQLARLARAAGVRRFLYASSCSMYGSAGSDDILTEEAPLRPLTAYATSKVRTEEDLVPLADHSFSPVFMRNATAYGLSPRLRADVVLNNFVCWAHTTGRIRILSDGTPWRPVVHVQDIARTFVAALGAPREAIHCQTFNVGATGENYQVRELAEIVRGTVPGCTLEYASAAGPDPRSYRVDFGKTRTFPDLKPQWNACFGAKDLYAALLEAEVALADFQGRKYISEYAYFSSYSDSWLQHARTYTDAIVDRLSLHSNNLVIELGSNDGYLLQYFVAKAIPVLGVDPTASLVDARSRTHDLPSRFTRHPSGSVTRGVPHTLGVPTRNRARHRACMHSNAASSDRTRMPELPLTRGCRIISLVLMGAVACHV